MKRKKVLIACEFSGTVRDEFRDLGHDAWSCDILPTEGREEYNKYHYQGNVLDIIEEPWDLLIAHPPCTFITNAGVRHLHSIPSRNGVIAKIHGQERFEEMRKACVFFNKLKHSNVDEICVENPIPHKYAREIIGKYDQLIQPWQYGHGETKATCLWLKNLKHLMPTNIVDGREPRIHKMPPGPERWKARSKTFPGIAKAMAEQWGGLVK